MHSSCNLLHQCVVVYGVVSDNVCSDSTICISSRSDQDEDS